jgi:hypothetical protein
MISRSKYGNRKVNRDGVTFDSAKEARRWSELLILEQAGAIQNLQRQVRYELLPSQRIGGKVAERAVHYVADFVYEQDGAVVVEDTKGFRTADYIIKRKLMLWRHGIKIREV